MKPTKQTTSGKREFTSINRQGIHAKSQMSKVKSSKNYFKKYKGQGK